MDVDRGVTLLASPESMCPLSAAGAVGRRRVAPPEKGFWLGASVLAALVHVVAQAVQLVAGVAQCLARIFDAAV